MGLGRKKDAGNNFLPVIKFNAKEGTLVCLDRAYEDGFWVPKERDITDTFEAVFDLEYVQIGWIKIQRGAAPDFVPVAIGTDPGEPPDNEYGLGVRLVMLMSEACGGGLRVLLNTSSSLWDGVSELHDKFENGAPDHSGELPVVRLSGVVERASKQSSTFVPVFVIVSWVARPAEIPKPADTPELTDIPLTALATKKRQAG
jgi:hypothetical protein